MVVQVFFTALLTMIGSLLVGKMTDSDSESESFGFAFAAVLFTLSGSIAFITAIIIIWTRF